MAEISKGINITYRWWNNDLESIDVGHEEALEESAFDHIGAMMDQGFTSGDLNDNIHMHDADPEDGIEYNGWWEVTTMETEDKKAAQVVKDAGPDLLLSLSEILAEYESVMSSEFGTNDRDKPYKTTKWRRARRAIRKATGK